MLWILKNLNLCQNAEEKHILKLYKYHCEMIREKKYIKSIEHRLISSRSIYLVKVQYIWITDWDFNRGNPNERTNTCRAEFCECWFPERDLLGLKGHRLWSLVNPPESSNTFGFLSTLLLVLFNWWFLEFQCPVPSSVNLFAFKSIIIPSQLNLMESQPLSSVVMVKISVLWAFDHKE